MLRILFCLISLFASSVGMNASAEEASKEYDEWWAGDDWKFQISPYLWLPGASGNAAVGPVSTSFDLSASDFLSLFQFGAATRLEVWKARWRFTGDVMGVLLDKDKTLSDGTTVDTDMGIVIFEWGVGYQLPELKFSQNRESPYPFLSFEPMAGGRFSFEDLDVSSSGGASAGRDSLWIEPFVGGRTRLQITKKVALYVRGDAGGFGIGSDLAWTLVAGAIYRPWKLVGFDFAWRLYDLDISDAHRSLNMRMQGPVLGATFHL